MGLAAKSLFQQDFTFLEILDQVSDNIRQINKWQEYFICSENVGNVAHYHHYQELPIEFEFQELPEDCLFGNVSSCFLISSFLLLSSF
jgi:hypothetical protein